MHLSDRRTCIIRRVEEWIPSSKRNECLALRYDEKDDDKVGDKVTKGGDCVGLRRKLLIMDGENNIVDRGEKAE